MQAVTGLRQFPFQMIFLLIHHHLRNDDCKRVVTELHYWAINKNGMGMKISSFEGFMSGVFGEITT
jgi:hypothetical protein